MLPALVVPRCNLLQLEAAPLHDSAFMVSVPQLSMALPLLLFAALQVSTDGRPT